MYKAHFLQICFLFRSLSFILLMASMAFVLLAACYVLVDVFHVWSGSPFLYPGQAGLTCNMARNRMDSHNMQTSMSMKSPCMYSLALPGITCCACSHAWDSLWQAKLVLPYALPPPPPSLTSMQCIHPSIQSVSWCSMSICWHCHISAILDACMLVFCRHELHLGVCWQWVVVRILSLWLERNARQSLGVSGL